MQPGTKRRWQLFFTTVVGVVASAIVFGAVAAISYFPKTPLLGAAFGALAAAFAALAVSAVIAAVEIFVPRTRLGLALDRAPFLVTFLVKLLVYGSVILLAIGAKFNRWLAAYLIGGPEAARTVLQDGGLPVAVSIMVTLLVTSVMILFIQFSGLVGGRTLRNIVLGRYHRSRTEERFFLFADIVGSTPLAEKLGQAAVHEFLNRVFQIASDPIDEFAGEVYQYVGDEIVVTWPLAEGRPGARPLACFFAIEAALNSAAASFEDEFGALPRLRGALHAGPVITGEVGGSRRAIVFHGDVMNTTSRIENATRELQRPFLVSEDALNRLEGTDSYALEDLGLRQLRGRSAGIRVYAVAPALGERP